ncbi:DEP domain-containing protein 1B-like [Homarus americanus]|uniref:DEP domain-containing protein 1B-like n=1 Tax=Homarus americanus TaxID=6706 RepID=UPI001C45438F|nr:DEP domain-containing protein 1B-like [Homarus americanus]
MASIHSGENAVNEVKDRGGMQECHLVAKQLSKAETNDVWKHVLLGKLDSVCERLLFGDTSCILDPRVVEGEWVHHNMTRVTSRGVVLAPDGHPDDLPNWILTAMKCMAHCKYLCVIVYLSRFSHTKSSCSLQGELQECIGG